MAMPNGCEEARWEDASDRGLVDGLRAGDGGAVLEFVRRFEHVARRFAHRAGVSRDEHAAWAESALYDVALTLGRRPQPPDHLGAYVSGACRYAAWREVARRRVREGALRDLGAAADDGDFDAVVGVMSAGSVRLARGSDHVASPLPNVLRRLAVVLDAGLRAEERDILRWLAQRESYTSIAKLLGVRRPTAVSRIQRLRLRLVDAAVRFGEALDGAERRELVRFLRRAGAITVNPSTQETCDDAR